MQPAWGGEGVLNAAKNSKKLDAIIRHLRIQNIHQETELEYFDKIAQNLVIIYPI
jgi:hypothetical protein